MNNEIAVNAPLNDKMEYSKALAHSNLLPKQYQGNPANLLFALEYADALDVSPINAITSIHVINGKPTASADLIAGLVRRAGHKLRISGDDTHAVAQIIRADDPDFTYEARWDMDKAKKAGLSTQTWKQYPGAMLRARAITEVARMGASDALFGVIYTPEELGAQVDADGEPVEAKSSSPMDKLRKVQQTKAEPEPAPEPTPDPEPEVYEAEVIEEAPDDGITDAQTKKIFAQFGELGISIREDYQQYIQKVVKRDIESSKELSRDEASAVIEAQAADLEVQQ